MYPSMHCCMSDLPVLQTASDQGGGGLNGQSYALTGILTNQQAACVVSRGQVKRSVREIERVGGGVYSSGISLGSLHITCSRLAPWPEVE